jgi:hypothetical protein
MVALAATRRGTCVTSVGSRRSIAGIGAEMVNGVRALAHAADFIVTNRDDSGVGSLRQAIEETDSDLEADNIESKSIAVRNGRTL